MEVLELRGRLVVTMEASDLESPICFEGYVLIKDRTMVEMRV